MRATNLKIAALNYTPQKIVLLLLQEQINFVEEHKIKALTKVRLEEYKALNSIHLELLKIKARYLKD